METRRRARTHEVEGQSAFAVVPLAAGRGRVGNGGLGKGEVLNGVNLSRTEGGVHNEEGKQEREPVHVSTKCGD